MIITKEIILCAELKNVWDFITVPENFPKYVYGYNNGKILTNNKTGVGARYEWYGKLWLFKLKSIEQIVEWQSQKKVGYEGKIFSIKFNSSMSVQKIGVNKTKLKVIINYEVPFYFNGIINFFISRIIENYVLQSLKNLDEILSKR